MVKISNNFLELIKQRKKEKNRINKSNTIIMKNTKRNNKNNKNKTNKTKKITKTINPKKNTKLNMNNINNSNKTRKNNHQTNHKNNKNLNTQKNNKNKSNLNVIFDIDETLINSQYYDIINNELCLTKNKNFSGQKHIYFIRPNAINILKWCYENNQLSFWTMGTYNYAISIITYLFYLMYPQDSFQKIIKKIDNLNLIMSRKYNHNKGMYQFYDLKTKKYHEIFNNENMLVKDLKYLFNDMYYSRFFNKYNTILIDDNLLNIVPNLHNSIIINPWYFNINNDKYLNDLQHWLYENRFKKKINIVDKPNILNKYFNSEKEDNNHFQDKHNIFNNDYLQLNNYNYKSFKLIDENNNLLEFNYETLKHFISHNIKTYNFVALM